jgi:ATP-dependent exoDNAse (exonuclease V) alpha subunit
VTAFSSQGLTAETATVVLDAGFDRHDSYVAMSRSRGDTIIFYDAVLLAAKMRAARELGAKTLEASENEKVEFLAASIGRANLKTSTLAFEDQHSQDRLVVKRTPRARDERAR